VPVLTPKSSNLPVFDLECRRCARLSGFLDEIAESYPEYHARPVAPFGDADPELLIVGLAPGMHGANATGRPFTGDYAGVLLYETLHRFGYSNLSESIGLDDGLILKDCRITNAVKCLPPQNKPLTSEVIECSPYLQRELAELREGAVIMALGGVAHNAVLRALGLKAAAYKFGHNNHYQLEQGHWLLDSYHCSRYNTQTRRLTPEMFRDVFKKADELLGRKPRKR